MRRVSRATVQWIKALHIALVGAWMGAGICMIVILFVKGSAVDGDELAAVYSSLKLIDDFVIIPGAIGALLTGTLMSATTNWGFFRFHWITLKWVVMVGAMLLGTFGLGPWLNGMEHIANFDRVSALANPEFLHNRALVSLAAPVQLASMVLAAFVSVFKPWGKRG